MNPKHGINKQLQEYLRQFETLYYQVLEDEHYIQALETLVDHYSQFILNPIAKHQFEDWSNNEAKASLTHQLQDITSQCVKRVEEIRAKRLLDGRSSTSGYFDNVEQCIHEEFGQFHFGKEDKLLLIGSGAYPMTLVKVAKETGASVIGIDIDSQAVDLGQRIVQVLAPNEDIVITNQTVEEIDDMQTITHIIFSSTIPVKYDILNQLHAITKDNVVVAMRYGDGIKSLFNYPSQQTEETKWRCVERLSRPEHIFDIALYRKASNKGGAMHV